MKVVKVLWIDSCNSNRNYTVAEDIEIELKYIDSFGVVVKETDEFLAIAQNYSDNPKQYSNITTIPKGCIKEVFAIHEDNVCEKEQKPAAINIDKMVDNYANSSERGNEEFGKPVPCMIRAYRQGLNDAIRKDVLKPWSEEDENIRKALIDGFKRYYDGSLFNGCLVRDIVAWLEEQCRHTLSTEGTFVNVDEVREDFMQEVYKILVDDITNDRANQIIDAFDHLPTSINQKPSDYVIKPKFHEGDWVIGRITDNEPRQIAEITKEGYKTTYGGWIGFSFEEDIHLWSIQDAKDGDVLAIEWNQDNDVWEKILIFKALNDNGVEGYGNTFKNKDLFFTDEKVPYYSKTWTKTLHPATKEQRDTLMKAMADAGYEFDFVKKELKKIELRSYQWNISDYKTWQYIVSDVLTKHDGIGQYLDDGLCKEIAQYMQEEWSKKLCSVQHPASWSEEDETKLKSTCALIRNTSLNGNEGIVDSTITFLKSLKDRVQPQREWSEEDEYCRNQLIVFCENCMQPDSGAIRCANWLKSLKDRYTWRPSDEQMKSLYKYAEQNNYDGAILTSLYKDLKQL